MVKSKDKKELRIQSLSQAFESLDENVRWIPTTKFMQEVVKALGTLDIRRTELARVTNHNAKLVDQLIAHTGMEIKNEQEENSIPDSEGSEEASKEE